MKQAVLRNGLLASSIYAAIAGAALVPQLANAHGYISEPPSRDFGCRINLNSGCGQAEYEPQSTGEQPEGFPARGPEDGKLIAGNTSFAALNEQSANRWYLNPLDKHEIDFKWDYTEGHVTSKWEYFVTKNDWNPNAPLARASFESAPFCSYEGNKKRALDPSLPRTHACVIPSDRSGHHVILGVWTVGDTEAAFYKAVDVDIQAEGGPAPEWRQVSNITPHRDLKVGDKVKARAFVSGAESEQYSASISIDSEAEGVAQNWSYKLAKQINDTQALVSAGAKDVEGNIQPVRGANLIFAKQESGVTNYELAFEGSPPDAYMHLHGVKPEYALKDGEASIDFSVMTNRSMEVTATLFNANNKPVGFQRQQVDSTTQPFALKATSVDGAHVLKIVGKNAEEEILLQEDQSLNLVIQEEATYQTFPDGLSSYTAGTRVYAAGTTDVYECKEFPFSGFCIQWSRSATQFEPGKGSAWEQAWRKVD